MDRFSLLGGETFINHDTIEPTMHHVMQNFADSTPLDARTGLIAAHQGTHTDNEDLFVNLADQHLKKIRDDARYLLVPVADVDDSAKWQRLQTFEAVGSNLLQFAEMFVPALGQLLMAEVVGEVLKEVYEGCHDCRACIRTMAIIRSCRNWCCLR